MQSISESAADTFVNPVSVYVETLLSTNVNSATDCVQVESIL